MGLQLIGSLLPESQWPSDRSEVHFTKEEGGIVQTDLREEAREKIRAQLQTDPLTGVEVWADGRKLASSEQEKLIGDVPI
jgi:hypothetical protein